MACQARVRISAPGGITGAGRVRDVSSSGAFIETTTHLPMHTRVMLMVLGNESSTRVVEIAAMVVRVARTGFAVEWCETPGGSICSVVGCTKPCADSKEKCDESQDDQISLTGFRGLTDRGVQ